MGLDKWIKPEKIKPKAIKKKEDGDSQNNSDSKSREKQIEEGLLKLTKFELICSKAKCKYKKTIVKKYLTEKDKICPRCKSEMKLK